MLKYSKLKMNELNRNFIEKLKFFFDSRNVIDDNRINFSLNDLRCVLDGFVRFFLRYKWAVNDAHGLVTFQMFLSHLNTEMQPYSNESKITFNYLEYFI